MNRQEQGQMQGTLQAQRSQETIAAMQSCRAHGTGRSSRVAQKRGSQETQMKFKWSATQSRAESPTVLRYLDLALHHELCLLRPNSLLRINFQVLTSNGREGR
jgi:hypothetical protein